MILIRQELGKFGAICECSRCSMEYTVKCKYTAEESPVGDLCNPCKRLLVDATDIDQTLIKKCFHYDPTTGQITNHLRLLRRNEGDLATFAHSGGYLSIAIGKKQYLAHRLIWLYMTGEFPEFIDHKNQIRTDNRWDNLRNVTQLENNKNVSLSKNNTIGITGVSVVKSTGRYRAYITVDYKQLHLGVFDTIQEATAARKIALENHNFFANHGK